MILIDALSYLQNLFANGWEGDLGIVHKILVYHHKNMALRFKLQTLFAIQGSTNIIPRLLIPR